MRLIDLDARKQGRDPDNSSVPIWLATFSHASMATPLRICSTPLKRLSDEPDILGVTSNGNDYLFAGMQFRMPDQDDQDPTKASLVFNTLHGASDFEAILSQTGDQIQVTIDLVLSPLPNVIVFSITDMVVTADTISDQAVVLSITKEHVFDTMAGVLMDYDRFPGGGQRV